MSKFVTFPTTQPNPDFNIIRDVKPEDVNEKKEQLTIIDVRTQEEYTGELGHIPGSRLISLDKLVDEINSLDKTQTLVFVCRSGGRSARATAFAKNEGFKSVYNMKGGMLLWNERGLDTERSDLA